MIATSKRGSPFDDDGVAAALAGRRTRPVGRDVVVDARDVLAHDLRLAGDDALHLEAERALHALLEDAHLRRVDRALERAALDDVADLVERHAEPVGERPHHRPPDEVERRGEQHRRRLVERTAEADQVPDGVGLVVRRVVEDLAAADLVDAAGDAGQHERQQVDGPAGSMPDTKIDVPPPFRPASRNISRSSAGADGGWRIG
jgi:hypothetical protein